MLLGFVATPYSQSQSSTIQRQSHHSCTPYALVPVDGLVHSQDSGGTYTTTPCQLLTKSTPSSSQMPVFPSSIFPTSGTCGSCGWSFPYHQIARLGRVLEVPSDTLPPSMASSWLAMLIFYAMQS